uniref:Uncharacterized protein n=1 Tax=Medicago truncatula TaxID=3880 RepID=I3SC16_MEDTR|nr:unknown [Medicago truncatula]
MATKITTSILHTSTTSTESMCYCKLISSWFSIHGTYISKHRFFRYKTMQHTFWC